LLLPVTSSTSQGSRGKPATRRTLLARREGLTAEYRAQASATIAAAVESIVAARVAVPGVVAIYRSKGSEVDTTAIDAMLRRHAYDVVYPRVVEGVRELAFHRVARVDELVASAKFGLREPRADAPTVGLEEIDAFVVPGLAFDRRGGRMGWGMGHYDATFKLARAGAVRIGVAFECQIVEESDLPREAHDELLHIIVTEAG
jgi:5-formyltetrahydrofolate cyclo-ligase